MLRRAPILAARRGSANGCQAAFGGFFIDRREVVAGLLHYLDDSVEGNGVATVGKRRIEVGVEGAGGGVGVALDAGNLNEATHRVREDRVARAFAERSVIASIEVTRFS